MKRYTEIAVTIGEIISVGAMLYSFYVLVTGRYV